MSVTSHQGSVCLFDLRLCFFCPLSLGPARRGSGNPGYASVTRWPERQEQKRNNTQQELLDKLGEEGGGGRVWKRKEEREAYLHHAADDLGKHVERKSEDVEE